MQASASSTSSLRALLDGFVVAPDIAVTDVTLDSRAVRPGAAFIALAGATHHGLTFAEQAIAQGARAIVYEPSAAIAPPRTTTAELIEVPHLRIALGAIADRLFGSPSAAMSVFGVTGTNGKTTSAYLLQAALNRLGRIAGYMGTLGFGHLDALQPSPHTTADCISVHRQLKALRDLGDAYVGMEVSSHALDQGRIDGVRIHSALFTNLTRDHLDYHGSIEAYGAAKERLFHRAELQQCVINGGDAFGRGLATRTMARSGHPPVTVYATSREAAGGGDRTLYATRIEHGAHGLRITFDGSFGKGVLDSRLIGDFNAENLLGVLGVLLGLDVAREDAVEALAQCMAPPGRMETLAAPGKPLVVIDYAHTPDALAKALVTARAHTRGKLWCVFGCGGDRDAGKRPLMGEIAESHADRVVLTDDNPRMEDPSAIVADILNGVSRPQAVIIERDRARAIARAIELASHDDLVLIAGKGHENYQIIGRNVKEFSDRDVARRCLGVAS